MAGSDICGWHITTDTILCHTSHDFTWHHMLESSPHSDLDCNQIYSFNQFLCTCRAFLETSYICGQLEGLNVVVELMGTIAIDTMDVSTVMVDGRFTGKECATV